MEAGEQEGCIVHTLVKPPPTRLNLPYSGAKAEVPSTLLTTIILLLTLASEFLKSILYVQNVSGLWVLRTIRYLDPKHSPCHLQYCMVLQCV